MRWTDLTDRAERSYGTVSLDEALAVVGRSGVRYAVDHRRLVPIHPGVYRVAGSPIVWEQELYAACVASGGVASHRAAARLWGISYVPAQRVEITVPTHPVVRLP